MSKTVDTCPLCGSKETQSIATSPLSQTVYGVVPQDRLIEWSRCEGCGARYVTNPLTPKETFEYLQSRSSDEEPPVGQLLHARLMQQQRILDKVAFHEGTTLLELGSDWGLFAVMAERNGYNVFIDELGERRREWSIKTWGLEPWKGQDVEVICAFDVLEHLEHPNDVLYGLKAHLKPGGALLVATPFYDGPYHQAHYDCDPMWGVPDHRFWFDRKSFRSFMARHGFRLLESWMHEAYMGSEVCLLERMEG